MNENIISKKESSSYNHILPTSNTFSSKKKKLILEDKRLQFGLYGCDLIKTAGIMLHLTEIAIATAEVFFQRFFQKEKNTEHFTAFFGAMTSLYLSTKVKEEKRRHRDILNIFDRILKRKEAKPLQREFRILDPCSQRYNKWKECMMKLELIMLRELGYRFYIVLPHDYLLQCIKHLKVPGIAETSWGYCNDALSIPDLALGDPKLASSACIYLAQKKHPNINLPNQWWKEFGLQKEEVENFSELLSELYTVGKSRFTNFKETHPDDEQPYIECIKYPTVPIRTKKIETSTIKNQMPLVEKLEIERKLRIQNRKSSSRKQKIIKMLNQSWSRSCSSHFSEQRKFRKKKTRIRRKRIKDQNSFETRRKLRR